VKIKGEAPGVPALVVPALVVPALGGTSGAAWRDRAIVARSQIVTGLRTQGWTSVSPAHVAADG
jgi:hypothetical protein